MHINIELRYLLFGLLSVFVITSVFASTYGFEYSTNANGTITITGIDGDVPEILDIPSVYAGKTVVGIGWGAFSMREQVKSVKIPSSIEWVGVHAFSWCTTLEEIIFEDGVVVIDEGAFYECSALKSIILPPSMKSLGVYAFEGCSGLTSVTILNGDIRIERGAFKGCYGLKDANGFVVVKNILFDYFGNSDLISIPTEVKEVSSGAFEGHTEIKSVTISDGVRINANAFHGCSGLQDSDGFVIVKDVLSDYFGDKSAVVIPNGVKSIGSGAFEGHSEINSITIPSSVVSIGYAFSGCSGLGDGLVIADGCLIAVESTSEEIVVPEGVRMISEGAFAAYAGSSGCKKVTLPNSVVVIGEFAFQQSGCDINIPTNIVEIADGTFTYSLTVKSLSIPDGVWRIGGEAFRGCYSVESVMLPYTTEFIGNCAFRNCENLEYVEIPGNVNWIGGLAFADCPKLKQINCCIGDGERVKELLKGSGFYGEVVESLPALGIHKFKYSVGEDGAITITGIYGEIPEALEIPEQYDGRPVVAIGELAFCDCCGITSVTIPASVMSIGLSAFSGCSGLVELTISSSKTSVPTASYSLPTFFGCSGLTKVTIPAWKLSSVFPQAYTTIKEVVICDGVSSITESMFAGCSELTSVTLPPSVVNIGDDAFNGCDKLTSVTIPANVTKIGSKAFCDCANLLSIEFKGDAPDCGDGVFEGTPRRLIVSVPSGSIGWDGGFTANLPEGWCGRAIVHSGESYDWDTGIAGVYLTTTNVVVHYVVNSVVPENVTPPIDTDFVAVLTEIRGGAVSVPQSWAEQFPDFTATFGSDFGKALTMATGKTGIGGAPMLVWQDYVAGTDPTNPDDKFTASITFDENNKPIIGWSPELKDERGNYVRKYTVYGKSKLNDVTWAEVKDDAENYNFFKVTVEMP